MQRDREGGVMTHEEQVSDFHNHLWKAIEILIERKHESQEHDSFMSWALQTLSMISKCPEDMNAGYTRIFHNNISVMKEVGIKAFLENSDHWKNNSVMEGDDERISRDA